MPVGQAISSWRLTFLSARGRCLLGASIWVARESAHRSTTSRSPSYGQYRHGFADSQSRLRQLTQSIRWINGTVNHAGLSFRVTEALRIKIFVCHFYRATAMLSAVLAIEILSSVCPSVCQTRTLWQSEQTFRQYCNTTWKAILSSFGKTENGWWRTIPSTRNFAPKWPTLYFKTHVAIDCAM